MDYQLFLALYPLLWLYFNRKSLATVVTFIVGCAVTLLYFTLVTYKLMIVPTLDYPMSLHLPLLYSHIRLYYTSPLIYLVPYLGGMYLAMRLAARHSCVPAQSVKPSTPFHSDLKILTLLSLLIGTVLLPLPGIAQKDTNPLENSAQYDAYMGVAQLAIALFGWLIIYQLTLPGKSWFKRTLSAAFLIPLSRLSFGMYLLNPLLIWFNVSMNHLTPRLSLFTNFQFAFSIYLQSILLSLLLTVFFESPVEKTLKLLLKGKMKGRKQELTAESQATQVAMKKTN